MVDAPIRLNVLPCLDGVNLKILITGVTGFLGGTTAALLIEEGFSRDLLFLVRASSPQEGLARVQDNLRKSRIGERQLQAIQLHQIILGDLGVPEGFLNDARLNTVTHVLNSAAVASFGNHPGIWPVNVVGTVAFAKRMAEVPGLKRFVHVGTAMACGAGKTSPVQESWDLATDEDHLVPYTTSKAEAERQMHRDIPNLPLVIARPSIVIGHSQYGCELSTSIFWVFRMAQDIGGFMCSFDDSVDVVPVDYCAKALKLLLLKDRLSTDIYHISAGHQHGDTFRNIERRMALSRGIEPLEERYHRFTIDEIPILVPEFQRRLDIKNRRLVAMALKLYGGFSQLNYLFDNSRLIAEGLPPPTRFVDYVARCIETTRDMPLLEQMMDDFK